MADVIGILGFALHAAHKVHDVIQTIKDAPDAVRALGKEASRVKGLLTVMLPNPNSEPSPLLRNDDDPLVKALVEDAQELETAVDALLAKAVRRKGDGTYAVRKTRWIFYAGEAEKLSSQFQAFYGSLTAVYAVATSYVLTHLTQYLSELILQTAPMWDSCVSFWRPYYQISMSIIV